MNKFDKIDATDMLRNKYGDEISPDIVSVLFCQSKERVWVTVKRLTASGTHTVDEISDLEVAMEIIGDPTTEDEAMFEPTFSPDVDIMTNANLLFEDKVTMMNITTIFD